MLFVVVLLGAVAQPVSYARNGSFDSLSSWTLPSTAKLVERAPGDQCVFLTDGMAAQGVWRRKDWQTMSAAVDIRVEELIVDEPGGFAFAAIYQYDEGGSLVAFRDFVQIREPRDWQRYTYTFAVEPETATLRMHFGFYQAHGRAYFDNWTLVEGEEAKTMDAVQEWATAGSLARKVTIWYEPDLSLPAGGLSPQWAMDVLRQAGIETDLVGTDQLADRLRPGQTAVLALPYGAMYPEDVRPALIDFCASGGKLLVVGGYPMNEPVKRENGRWVDWRERWRTRQQEVSRWPNNLLPDGGFEAVGEAPVGGREIDGKWRRDHAELCTLVREGAPEGAVCAAVEVRPDEEVGERKWFTWLPTRPARDYVFRAKVRTEGIRGAHYAYVAVYQYAGDKLVKSKDVVQLRGDNDWHEVEYAFKTEPGVDALYIKMGLFQAQGKAWFDQVQLVDVTGLAYRPLNTSTGEPGDGLQLAPYQMGMCDAHFPLKRVAAVTPSPGQNLVRSVRVEGSAKGWATVGVTGYGAARWTPLLDATDRYGRLRGAAGALLLHYGGFYDGSLWAYFGVEDRPLFGPQVKGSDADLVRIVKHLVQGLFLYRLRTDFDSYRPGETAHVSVSVANCGPDAFDGEVQISLEGRGVYGVQKVPVKIKSGGEMTAEAEVRVPDGGEDLLCVMARLVAEARPLDETQRGFVVRRPEIDRQGPRLTFEDNYFRLDGRPIFLFGSDNYSNDYKSDVLNPRRWDEIHALARDYGLQVYENLQYSNPGHKMQETDWRAFEGMGQLLMKRGLVFMCGLLIGHNVAVNDEELAAEGRQCFEYAERLGKMPAMLWYINGDYQLRYEDLEWLKKAWNQWLSDKYKTDEALRQAWGRQDLPVLGELPFPPAQGNEWSDRPTIDRMRFNVWLMRRWNENHVAEIQRGDREHAITSEYYSEPFGGIDQRQTIDGQHVANFGFFSTPQDDLTVLPERLAINDLRAVGKGVSIGEYGVKTHPGWTVENGARGYHIVRTEEEQKQLFMSVAAYALGMGACKIQNWCLRDADEGVFPWGYFYPGRNVPKDVAYVHRNLSLLWRLVEPRYEAPAVSLVVPTPLRMGPLEGVGRDTLYRAAQGLLRLHVPFTVLDDFDIKRVPAATKTLVWPAAIAEAQEDFDAAVAWVRNGGQLLLTGFPAWDENRQLLGERRLQELLGCGGVEKLFEGLQRGESQPVSATLVGEKRQFRPQVRVRDLGEAQCVLQGEGGTPLILRRALDRGSVVWIADPVELVEREQVMSVVAAYDVALNAFPQPPERLPVEPANPEVHVTRQRTASGWVWVAYDTRLEGKAAEITVRTSAGALTLNLRPRWPAVAVTSDDGRLLLVLADAPVKVDGRALFGGRGTFGMASLDGRDLRQAAARMICPFATGRVDAVAESPLAVEWGEWRDGKWTVLEKSRGASTSLRCAVDDDRATLVGLACPPGETQRWRTHLQALATTPWRLRGY